MAEIRGIHQPAEEAREAREAKEARKKENNGGEAVGRIIQQERRQLQSGEVRQRLPCSLPFCFLASFLIRSRQDDSLQEGIDLTLGRFFY